MQEKVEKTDNLGSNWNIAIGFSNLMILKQIAEMGTLVKIALYGYENLQDKYYLDSKAITHNRVESINRLVDLLGEIVENSYFACKKKDRERLDIIEERIERVKKYSVALTTEKIDQRSNKKVLEINERHFDVCLSELRRIKKGILIPLNNSGLIFAQNEDLSIEDLERRLVEGGG